MILHAGTKAGCFITGQGVGCHRYDGQRSKLLLLADTAGGFITIHVRHLDIHQN